MKNKIIALGALGIFLGAQAVQAQENDALVAKAGNKGAFVYMDYFNYMGVGAPGRLVSKESNALVAEYFAVVLLNKGNVKYAEIPTEPSGNMTGGTIGYSWEDQQHNTYIIRGGYRSGSIDGRTARIEYTSKNGNPMLYENYYEQNTDEYRLMGSFSPKEFSFLTVGIEGLTTSYKATFTQTDKYAENTASGQLMGQYGFSSKATDLIGHVTLKSPIIPLLTTEKGGLSLSPNFDIGVGCSLRNGSTRPGSTLSDDFRIIEAKEYLGKDALVYESTATISFSYIINSSRILLDTGYRIKSDISSGSSYGTTQKGVYARLGFAYSW